MAWYNHIISDNNNYCMLWWYDSDNLAYQNSDEIEYKKLYNHKD